MIEYAKKIVRANRYDKGTAYLIARQTHHVFLQVIKIVKGKIEDIVLPEGIQKVDVIIAEWMGYSLFYDSIIQSVIYARDKYLVRSNCLHAHRQRPVSRNPMVSSFLIVRRCTWSASKIATIRKTKSNVSVPVLHRLTYCHVVPGWSNVHGYNMGCLKKLRHARTSR